MRWFLLFEAAIDTEEESLESSDVPCTFLGCTVDYIHTNTHNHIYNIIIL